MSKDAVETKLKLLDQAKARGQSQLLEALRQMVGDRSNLVIAKVAQLAAEAGADEFAPQLARAFEAFMADGVRKDKRCHAKVEIVKYLRRVRADEQELFLRGATYVQMEPAYGGAQDSAAPLRVECAAGLVESGDRRAEVVLAELLADPEADARIGAARLLAQTPLPSAEPLLRLRALAGDADPAVLQEYFAALLELNPAAAVEFCSRFLGRRGASFEAAAMALGESRLEQAFAVLAAAAPNQKDPTRRKTIMTAIALMRRNDAMDFLVTTIATEPELAAIDAVEALAIYDRDESLVHRVRQTVAKRGSPKLRQAVEKSFG